MNEFKPVRISDRINIHPTAAEESERCFRRQMRLEVCYIIAGNYEGYVKCHEEFIEKGVPDFRPTVMDAIWGSNAVDRIGRPTLRTYDYRDNFEKEKFKNQWIFTEYLTNSFEQLKKDCPLHFREHDVITAFAPEYQTSFGRADFYIIGKYPFLLELKIDRIQRKDIYQCLEYMNAMKGDTPAAIIGHRIKEDILTLAQEHNISVYTYSIARRTPTKIITQHIQGDKYKVLDKAGDFEYIFKEWRDFAL